MEPELSSSLANTKVKLSGIKGNAKKVSAALTDFLEMEFL